jgi:hypothetical protein
MRGIASAVVVSLFLVAACGGSSSPTSPTPSATPSPSTPTRIIGISGSLAFGNVTVGQSKDLSFTISNSGNSALTISGLSITSGLGSIFTSDFASGGTIAAGGSRNVLVRFTPTAAQVSNGTITANGDQTSGSNTITVSGTAVSSTPSGPRTQFGSGQWRVGTDIAAGRYFSDPSDGCYWERQRGLSGSLSDVIANEFIGFNAAQWIVDIASSDVAFKTDAECGTWFNTARHGPQTSIVSGIWLVGTQVAPGVYRTNAAADCYWERLRDFSGTLDGIIGNDFIPSSGQVLVEIRSSDIGFHADAECGTWTRTSTSVSGEGAKTRADIRRNREANELRAETFGLRRAPVGARPLTPMMPIE